MASIYTLLLPKWFILKIEKICYFSLLTPLKKNNHDKNTKDLKYLLLYLYDKKKC